MKISKKKFKKFTDGAQNFRIEKINFSSKIVTSKAFQRMTDETLHAGEPFIDWQNFGTTDEAQNFRIQKKEQHRIMEDRIKYASKNKKPQRSSFKITTCERFQMVNNDALQELCQVRHHVTSHWSHNRFFTS